MRLPLLGVMVGMHAPAALGPLLVALSGECVPVACTVLEPFPVPAPAAYLWCGGSTPPPAGTPHAAWLHTSADLDRPETVAARVLLSDSPRLAGLAGDRGLLVPPRPAEPDARWVPPAVRRRLRAARGLPAAAVARHDGAGWHWPGSSGPLPVELVPTAVGCAAAAAVATADALATALAWGTPAVADPVSAAALDARDGVEVLVAAEAEQRWALADRLAGDEALAAGLSWAGWQLAGRWTGLGQCARRLLGALGLPPHPLSGRFGRLDEQLDLLGTPPHSLTRERARALVAPLPPIEGAP